MTAARIVPVWTGVVGVGWASVGISFSGDCSNFAPSKVSECLLIQKMPEDLMGDNPDTLLGRTMPVGYLRPTKG